MRAKQKLFNYNNCKKNCGCCIDPIKTLVEGYKSFVWEKLEACLSAKWSVGDCVAGCPNEYYSETESTHRNPHQRRVSKVLVARLAKALTDADDFPENPKDFETIYDWVSKIVEETRRGIKGNEMDESDAADQVDGLETLEELFQHICPLLKYDTALRMSYNLAGPNGEFIPPESNVCLPKKFVYLQRGALWGAQELLRISQLSQEETDLTPKKAPFIFKEYVKETELDGPCRIEISKFNKDLQSLGSYHLENFLCIFHQLFEDWAEGYEQRLKIQKNKQQ